MEFGSSSLSIHSPAITSKTLPPRQKFVSICVSQVIDLCKPFVFPLSNRRIQKWQTTQTTKTLRTYSGGSEKGILGLRTASDPFPSHPVLQTLGQEGRTFPANRIWRRFFSLASAECRGHPLPAKSWDPYSRNLIFQGRSSFFQPA